MPITTTDGSCAELPGAASWKDILPQDGCVKDVGLLDNCCEGVALEWWYSNAILRVKGEPKSDSIGFFASFFRRTAGSDSIHEEGHHSACIWALADNKNKKYYPDVLMCPEAPNLIRRRIDPEITGRPHVHGGEALLQMMKRGHLPRPERVMKNAAVYTQNPIRIDLDGECILETKVEGCQKTYHFIHKNPSRQMAADLTFRSDADPVIHGKNGMVNGMYYYYFPSMEVTGTVTINGDQKEVEGSGWYDREFGGELTERWLNAKDTWEWMALRLSNGSQISFFRVSSAETKEVTEVFIIYTGKDKCVRRSDSSTLTVNETWTSLISFQAYPKVFTVDAPEIGVRLEVRTVFDAQEISTLLLKGGGFLEGCVVGNGTVDGEAVEFEGFVECKRNYTYTDTKSMLKQVSTHVGSILRQMYPLQTSDEWIKRNLTGRHSTESGTPTQILCDVLFAPMRLLIDRGGKSWRSLILILSCNALSKDYFDCTGYIAMAELIHVASLTIDDIQDESKVRRGGEAVHEKYGLPTAVNAGTLAYFMAPHLAEIHNLPHEKASRIYELYFDAMKSGHAGQGLDIFGLDYLMPDFVRTGDEKPLIAALEAIHTYKTGGAAGTVCLVASILCDADEVVSKAMGNFGVKLGIAFQIVDDVLDIKGFDNNLKAVGGDVREGKVTFPIAHAMSRLDLSEREDLWSTLRSKPDDEASVTRVIDIVRKTGALEHSLSVARRHIEEGWNPLEPLLEDSVPKMLMHSFCSYLIERTW